MNLHIGQLVERVSPPSSHDSRFAAIRWGISLPKVGEKVRIRTIESNGELTFEEHDNRRFVNWLFPRYEPAFPARHFRAVEVESVIRLVSDNAVKP